MAPMQWTKKQKISSGVWSVAIAAVVVVGSLTGAQIKADRQKEEAIKQFRGTSAEEQIAALEARRKHLVQERDGLQRKLDLFHNRVRERQLELEKRDK
ncbi:hypothetical protein HJFPF1_05198 [Paramyrothecium foliicola]|nr:hypothetical protein HJFPF1_05198 [Paramyrothecium foliicola]